MPARIETPVLGCAELVEDGRLAERRVRLEEGGLRPAPVGRTGTALALEWIARSQRVAPGPRFAPPHPTATDRLPGPAHLLAYSVAGAFGAGISHAPWAQIS